MKSVRFSVFSDLHYRDGNWNQASERLDSIQKRAAENKVDFVIHCGDFCHNVVTGKEIIDRYNHFSIPSYHTIGNHDFEQTDGLEIVCRAFGMKNSYYSFDVNSFRIISLDTNFYRSADGTPLHYASGDSYAKCHQEELYVPPQELDFLREAIETAEGPCLLFSHGSFVRPDGVANSEEILSILRDSRHRTGRVLMCINGHHHRNNLRILDNIAFFELNSTTSDWINHPHHSYPPELMAKYENSDHELLFTDPVHALVTVTEDGEIRIEGMKGSMYLGITREMTGNTVYDRAGLPCDPSVLSAHFKLFDDSF